MVVPLHLKYSLKPLYMFPVISIMYGIILIIKLLISTLVFINSVVVPIVESNNFFYIRQSLCAHSKFVSTTNILQAIWKTPDQNLGNEGTRHSLPGKCKDHKATKLFIKELILKVIRSINYCLY